MDIRRYDRMPFYFAPVGTHVVNYEDKFLNYLDWLVDAHEDARNDADTNRNFYQRATYVWQNFHRYQNETMANCMFDTKAPRPAYDKLNSVVGQQNLVFYGATTLMHGISFTYLSFFFRYRRVGFLPTVAIGTAYYMWFEASNNIMYKVLVDRNVLNTARSMGMGEHCQPLGQSKCRDLNWK